MTYTLPISKRGTLTLPPELRRRLQLDQVASPLVIIEERDGGLFLQSAVAMPIRDIPKATIRQWVLNDEADAKDFIYFRAIFLSEIVSSFFSRHLGHSWPPLACS